LFEYLLKGNFMKLILSLLTLVFALGAVAEDITFSDFDTPRKELDADKLRWKVEIQGDLLVFNKTGTRLLFKSDEERKWRFGNEKPITSYWNVASKGLPTTALYHEWQFSPQGELQVKFRQYDSMSMNRDGSIKTGKLLQEKDLTIENMAGPSIVLFQDDTRRIVAQFRIQIWSEENAIDIGKLGINSNRMTVYDNKGNVWASRLDNSTGNNIYYGLTTHMGTVYISYLPFEGAKKIGIAEKNRIRIEHGPLRIAIESNEAFLPRGVQANIYGIIDLNKRTERLNQVRSNGSDKESNFLEAIKKK